MVCVFSDIVSSNKNNLHRTALVDINNVELSYNDLFLRVYENINFLKQNDASKFKRVGLLITSNYDSLIIEWFLAVSTFSEVIIIDAGKSIDEKIETIRLLDINCVIMFSEEHSILLAAIQGLHILNAARSLSNKDLVDCPDLSTYECPLNKIALLLQTSGTTGKPKTIGLTHAAIQRVIRQFNQSLSLRSDDKCLNMMPMFHYHGLIINALNTLWSGGCIVCANGYIADCFETSLEKHQITWFSAVSGLLNGVLEDQNKMEQELTYKGLRFIRSSSHPLSEHSLHALEGLYNCPVVESYGLTEVGTICCNPVDKSLRKINSVGIVVQGVQVEIRDDHDKVLPMQNIGEIFARSEAMVKGYIESDRDKGAFSNGWFKTEDVGYFDNDGFLFIKGRKKDCILLKGGHFFPADAEGFIANLTGAKDCVLVNLSSNINENNIVAVLVGTYDANRDRVNSRLKDAGYQIQVEEFRNGDNLQYNSIGKPLKLKLRESMLESVEI